MEYKTVKLVNNWKKHVEQTELYVRRTDRALGKQEKRDAVNTVVQMREYSNYMKPFPFRGQAAIFTKTAKEAHI